MPRVLGANDFDISQTWVDASYATHHDMRGHTWEMIYLGYGIIHDKYYKQKLNTKSLTETQVVGPSDCIGHILYNMWFLKERGYTLSRSIFYQENESVMKMEKNRKRSCVEKSRHISIIYVFIEDVLSRNNIEVVHYPIEIMIADSLPNLYKVHY